MSKTTRTTAQEAWKQTAMIHTKKSTLERPPIPWSNARLVEPMYACAQCHTPRTVYAEGDRCVECRSVTSVYQPVVERRRTGIYAKATA